MRLYFFRTLFIDITIAFSYAPLYSLKRMKLIMMRHADHFENALTKYGVGQIAALGEALPQIIATHGIDVSKVLFLVSSQGRTMATAHRLKGYLESHGMQHSQREVVDVFDGEESADYQQAAELIAERCKREDCTLVWVVTHLFHMANVPDLVLCLVRNKGEVDPFQFSTAHCDPILIDMTTGKSWYPL